MTPDARPQGLQLRVRLRTGAAYSLHAGVFYTALAGAVVALLYGVALAGSAGNLSTLSRVLVVNFTQIVVACWLALAWLHRDAGNVPLLRQIGRAAWVTAITSLIASPIGLLEVGPERWTLPLWAGKALSCYGFAFGLAVIECVERITGSRALDAVHEWRVPVAAVATLGATLATVFAPPQLAAAGNPLVVIGRFWLVNFVQIAVACALALWWLRRESSRSTCGTRRLLWTGLWASALAGMIAAPMGLLVVSRANWNLLPPASQYLLADQFLKCFGFALGLCLIEAFVRVEVRRERAVGAARHAALASNRSELAARLAALQAQIEPHFIYNTLGNVRALVRTAPAQAEQLLTHLTAYLRAAMPSLRVSWRTVGQELDLAADYLAVMQVRLGNRLRVRIEADDATGKLRVAPGLVTTLLENAIKHGIDPLPEGGEVAVCASQQDGALIIEVRDTGAGLAPGEGSGVGLANLLERLSLLYDGRATFDLTPNTPRGAVARITIPLEALTAAHADRADS